MRRRSVTITKASGEEVPFSETKLRESLEKSGATDAQIDSVISEVHDMLFEGIGTGKIYRKAYQLLKSRSRPNAARYKLKKAIMELGPSGYPFERFVAALFAQQGYTTEVGVLVDGRCVRHEVDVMARRNAKLVMVECKFHNRPGVKCDVKIPLYIHSRFRDIIEGNNPYSRLAIPSAGSSDQATEANSYEGWIVTNTRFTDDAIRFGTCSGMVMLGWDYPKNGSLKERIGLAGLHPLTCLSSLNQKEKQYLLDKGVVLCRKVRENQTLLLELGLNDRRLAKVLKECDELVFEKSVPAD